MGQGFVETDNGAGSILNAKRFSLMPREVPDLVKRLLMSAQQPQATGLGVDAAFPFLENFHISRTTNFNKREESSTADSYNGDESTVANYEKREDASEDAGMSEMTSKDSRENVDSVVEDNSRHESNKRYRKTEMHPDEDVEDKLLKGDKGDREDDELNNKLKSLQRRDDIEDEYSSLSERSDDDSTASTSASLDDDQSERIMLSRNDEDSNLTDE